MADSLLLTNGAPARAPTTVILRAPDLTALGFTGRELAQIKANTGHSLSALMADEADDDKFIVLAWLKLRRDGNPIEWEDMLDVVVDFRPGEGATPDPTNAPLSPASPRSAIGGA